MARVWLVRALRLWCFLGWIVPVWLWRIFWSTDFFGQMADNPRMELVNQLSLWGTYVTLAIWLVSWIAMPFFTLPPRHK